MISTAAPMRYDQTISHDFNNSGVLYDRAVSLLFQSFRSSCSLAMLKNAVKRFNEAFETERLFEQMGKMTPGHDE